MLDQPNTFKNFLNTGNMPNVDAIFNNDTVNRESDNIESKEIYIHEK